MKILKSISSAFALFLLLLPARAQLGQEELEGLERHRKPHKTISILQSIDEPADTSSATASLIGTWEFLDEQDKAEDAQGAADEKAFQATVDLETLKGRLDALPEELMIPYRRELEQQLVSYVVRHAGALRGILGKYFYYEPYIKAAFSRHALPEGLTALAIVESAMNPLAVSRVGAKGMWQFMKDAAKQYGLICDRYVDERLDPLRSADAAARYLRDAYSRYGSWALAVSSYNCGPAAVDAAIRKAGSAEFWDVYPFLPAETKEYMPAFVAALYTLEYYKLHGIEPRPYSEGALSSFQVTRKMTYADIIKATGIDPRTLIALNPQYTRGIIPGDRKKYILRIPRKYAKLFKDNIDVVTD